MTESLGILILVLIGIKGAVEGILLYLTRKETAQVARKAEEVRLALLTSDALTVKEAKEVKTALSVAQGKTVARLDQVAETAAQTHALVNSGQGKQLQLILTMARRLAVSGDPADLHAVHLAEVALAEHQERQNRADTMDFSKVRAPDGP